MFIRDNSSLLTNAVLGSQRHKIESSGFFPIDVLCREKMEIQEKQKGLKNDFNPEIKIKTKQGLMFYECEPCTDGACTHLPRQYIP